MKNNELNMTYEKVKALIKEQDGVEFAKNKGPSPDRNQ